MDYIENNLTYEDYVALRTSVNWCNFNEEQTRKSVSNSLYTITVIEDNRAIAMGRMIGDGMYFLIVDVVVRPEYQGKGIGSQIMDRLSGYVDSQTPVGGRSSVQLIAEKGKEELNNIIGNKHGFETVKPLDLIKKITTSNLCDKLSNKMTDFIWGMEAFNCKSIEKRQWGYSVIKRCFNDCLFREELNKINFNFHSFLKLAENQYFNDFTFYGRKIKLFLKYCLGKQ